MNQTPDPRPFRRCVGRALGILLGGLLALAGAGPAAADAPVFEGPYTEEGTAVIADCGAFQVLDRYVLTYTIARFSDRDGTQLRLIEQLSGTDTFVNSVTGAAYPTRFHNTVIVDPAVTTQEQSSRTTSMGALRGMKRLVALVILAPILIYLGLILILVLADVLGFGR